MPNLQTPLFPWHVQHGARMVPFGGWDMPVQYSGVIDEHKAVRSAVGLFDISHMARLMVHGPGAQTLLETTFTNSVGSMKIGQVRYGLVCNEHGGILDDILITRFEDHYAVCVNASNREKVVAWLASHATGLEVTVRDGTFTSTMIAVQGPQAVATVRGLVETDVSGLKYYFAAVTSYRGEPCMVSRTGYTGEDGFELVVMNHLGPVLWEDLIARGAKPCGLGARDTLRLEAAMPLYGHELNETIDPIQAGLGWAVKLDKGPFLGRDALKAIAAQPESERKTRIGLVLEGKRAAREGSGILDVNQSPIGTITSGSYVPGLEKSIAMGQVPQPLAKPGTKLLVDVRGTHIPAEVVALPFYKRSA